MGRFDFYDTKTDAYFAFWTLWQIKPKLPSKLAQSRATYIGFLLSNYLWFLQALSKPKLSASWCLWQQVRTRNWKVFWIAKDYFQQKYLPSTTDLQSELVTIKTSTSPARHTLQKPANYYSRARERLLDPQDHRNVIFRYSALGRLARWYDDPARRLNALQQKWHSDGPEGYNVSLARL